MDRNPQHKNGTSPPRVVIVGGGFGGLQIATALGKSQAAVILIDRRNYHLFQPMLYQVATAELSPANIAAPLRSILRKQKNTDVVLGEVTSVDLDQKIVRFNGGEISYDYLVLATGVRQSYFGHDEFAPFAPGLKSIDDALELRRRILLAFEEAEWEADEASRRAKLTFVIVGGGPTGVELAGAIMDIASNTLPSEFRNIDTKTARVILIEGSPRLIAAMPEDLSKRVHKALEEMHVEIRLHTIVTNVDDTGVYIGDEHVPAENVFWAAGVQGQALAHELGVEIDRGSRIVVGPDLSIPDHPEVFVVGDAAHATDATSGKPVPGVAQGAIQSGRFVAEQIKRELEGGDPKNRPAFSYHDKGSMAMIGRGNAVAAIGKRHFGGLLGWLTWSVVHVMFLVGFGNKLTVMCDWFWNYIRHTRQARLITGDPEFQLKQFGTGGKTDATPTPSQTDEVDAASN
ncbi:NADH dehydrogenase-like protein [Symmachiella macrocystis]|uniref:NADH:ubiquinone reductase (non-electrogenic) n=1 Tax=Symmachiella macrocystis TaxID=2527985 RepID=A0A5C6BS08_9PLAN|nr:NAD(P)/FAD-dependent oxidoreductase [Symmachiella macrocystis]TWU13474.1 NADH dehydrogenase-like protein [Symmachiella macrocystis]